MTAPHFFADDVRGEVVRIGGEDARHALKALRLRPGEEITVSDDRGTVVRARVRPSGGTTLEAEVVERRAVAEALPAVTVCPAVPKSGKLDLEVQKLTELGVSEIRPWFAARSVPRWDAAKASRQGERLRSIARQAATQSRRPFLPAVRDPGPFPVEAGDPGESRSPGPSPVEPGDPGESRDAGPSPVEPGDAVGSTDGRNGLVIVLHEEAAAGLGAMLPVEPPPRVTLVIGPEGGLAPDELERLREAGALVAGLGPAVLRTETAALVAATLVLARYGRIG